MFPHSHGFSELVTQAQAHPVSWDILCLTWILQCLIFSFLFPSLWPLSTLSGSLCGFILALLIHSMHSSKIPLILLHISVSFQPHSLPLQLCLLYNRSLSTVIRGKIPPTHNNLEEFTLSFKPVKMPLTSQKCPAFSSKWLQSSLYSSLPLPSVQHH